MSNLLELPNGNHVAPYLIRGIRRVPKKGLILVNEFNKLMDFSEEPNDLVIKAYSAAIKQVIDAGKRFEQPDWEAIRKAVILGPQTRLSVPVAEEPKKSS